MQRVGGVCVDASGVAVALVVGDREQLNDDREAGRGEGGASLATPCVRVVPKLAISNDNRSIGDAFKLGPSRNSPGA